MSPGADRARLLVGRLRPVARTVGRRLGIVPPRTNTELVIDAGCAASVVEGWESRRHALAQEHHVTLIDPFVPTARLDEGVLAGVREVIATFEPFTYELARVERFPGVLYLAPEPSEPFVALTEALWHRFPDCPPYAGAFARIVPHVTLLMGPEPSGLADFVARRLPVRGHVDHVELRMEDANGRWGVAQRFALGIPA